MPAKPADFKDTWSKKTRFNTTMGFYYVQGSSQNYFMWIASVLLWGLQEALVI